MMRLLLASILILLTACDQKKDTGDAKSDETVRKQEKPEASKEGESAKKPGDGFVKLSGNVTYTLDDGEKLNSQFPDSFEIPSREARENLKKGTIVKLVFIISDKTNSQTERMWVIVDEINEQGYTGTLDNDPYCTDKIKSGLKVNFEAKHVISIYSASK